MAFFLSLSLSLSGSHRRCCNGTSSSCLNSELTNNIRAESLLLHLIPVQRHILLEVPRRSLPVCLHSLNKTQNEHRWYQLTIMMTMMMTMIYWLSVSSVIMSVTKVNICGCMMMRMYICPKWMWWLWWSWSWPWWQWWYWWWPDDD